MEQAAPRARVAPATENFGIAVSRFKGVRSASNAYESRVDDSKIERMRGRARQMRRAASMTHNPEIHAILTKAADEAEADAAELEAALNQPPMPLPPQG